MPVSAVCDGVKFPSSTDFSLKAISEYNLVLAFFSPSLFDNSLLRRWLDLPAIYCVSMRGLSGR